MVYFESIHIFVRGEQIASLAKYLNRFKPFAVSAVTSLAMDLEREGLFIIRHSAGKPDFETSGHIKPVCKI